MAFCSPELSSLAERTPRGEEMGLAYTQALASLVESDPRPPQNSRLGQDSGEDSTFSER